MSIRLISRNDDFGSSRAANKAILEAVDCGLITRNVSCMAPAPYMAEAAEELKRYRHIDIGMHATLTSEWDGIRWGAMTELMRKSDYTYEDGSFFHSQKEIVGAGTKVEMVLAEYDAQLDYLTSLGLNISYVDSHMFPEYYIDELYDAFLEWTYKKGLLCAEDYYYFANPICPETKESEEDYLEGVRRWLEELLNEKQYFYLAHPAYPCDEALLMYNDDIPKGAMLLERKMEYKAMTSRRWEMWFEKYDICPIRYSEAKKQERGSIKQILNL